MTNDWQEAESRKYSLATVMVLPLSSGRVAIFSRAFRLDRIIEDPDLHALALSIKPPEASQPSSSTPTISTDDLDI